MNLIIKLFIVTVPLSIVIHILVGVYLKSLLKKHNKFDLYKVYAKKHKEEKTLKDYCQNLVFLIPIFNMLIAIVEVGNIKQCYPNLLNELADFEKKERKKGNEDLPEKEVRVGEYDELLEEVKQESAKEVSGVTKAPEKLTEEELDDIADEYHEFLKENSQQDNDIIDIQNLKEQAVNTKIG